MTTASRPRRPDRTNCARKKRQYARRKAWAVAYLGARCAECPRTTGLEFDHVSTASKRYDFSACWSLAWATFVDEIEKMQLLCTDCHSTKTAAERAAGLHRPDVRLRMQIAPF